MKLVDVRRWAALRTIGASRLILKARGAINGAQGALEARQNYAAVMEARSAILTCLSIRSLAVGGSFDDSKDQLTFDPFYGLSEAEVQYALSLVGSGIASVDDSDHASTWMETVVQYVDDTEQLLGFEDPLPVIRSPNGMFASLRLAREWMAILDELNLPNPIPAEWIN